MPMPMPMPIGKVPVGQLVAFCDEDKAWGASCGGLIFDDLEMLVSKQY